MIFGFPPLQTAYPVLFLNHGPDLDAPSCDGGYKLVKKIYSSYCIMPYISDDNRKVNVYYPESDPTWTPEVLKALGNYNPVVGYPWMKMGCITMNGAIGRSR